MSGYFWERRLAAAMIKSIISSGRLNAARKYNKELAATGRGLIEGDEWRLVKQNIYRMNTEYACSPNMHAF